MMSSIISPTMVIFTYIPHENKVHTTVYILSYLSFFIRLGFVLENIDPDFHFSLQYIKIIINFLLFLIHVLTSIFPSLEIATFNSIIYDFVQIVWSPALNTSSLRFVDLWLLFHVQEVNIGFLSFLDWDMPLFDC